MQPRPSRWMQYHQLVEPLLAASQFSVMLYGPLTVRRRLVGADGPSEGGGGGGGGGFFPAAAPAMKTKASTRTLAASMVRLTVMDPPGDGCGRRVIRPAAASGFPAIP